MLPTFPWDTLVPARKRAAEHPDGVVDLSIGTPVDPVPEIARDAFVRASDYPGYPPTIGSAEVREAIVGWARRRRGASALDAAGVLPTVGSKELVASLPAQLGIGAGERVLFPQMAYPTYDVGARLVGAEPVAVGPDPAEWSDASLVWLNSPSNPTGRVDDVEALRRIVAWARAHQCVVASDECYAELAWEGRYAITEDGLCPNSDAHGVGAPSILDDAVCDGDYHGLLMVYSASKQSNMAGYRAAFVAGDTQLIADLAEVRKHGGLMMPGPSQAALAAALSDDAHVAMQRERYRARRNNLLAAAAVGGLVNHPQSHAGLYLWLGVEDASVTSAELVAAFADLGIVVAPSSFYGTAEPGRVRVALTASDEDIARAAQRLTHFSVRRAK
nr:succinyldiaminopimelate transaminase [Nanchangia anserum]